MRTPSNGSNRKRIVGGSAAPPLVDTEAVNGEGTPFAKLTLAGTWHVAPVGAPLHTRATLPLYPTPGVNCNWYCAT
jgi:hypothetical protein